MTWQEFEQQFSIQLNEQQKSTVQSVDGPVLLLAVPGSGRTRKRKDDSAGDEAGVYDLLQGDRSGQYPDGHLYGGGDEGHGGAVCGKIRTGDGRPAGISDH